MDPNLERVFKEQYLKDNPPPEPQLSGKTERYQTTEQKIKAAKAKGETYKPADLVAQENALKLAASGVMQIPTDAAALANLAISGTGAAVQTAINYDKDKTITQNYAREFADTIMVDGSEERIQAKVLDAVRQITEQNPAITQEELDDALERYTDTDAFVGFVNDQLQPGLRIGAHWGNYANKLVGLDKRVDQQTPGEDILQIFSQALIPTASVKSALMYPVKTISKAVAKSVVEDAAKLATKIGQTKAGRVAKFAGEVALPGTSPYTKGRVAANAAIGTTINEGLRYAGGRDTATGQIIDQLTSDEDVIHVGDDANGEPMVEHNPLTLKPMEAAGEPAHGLGHDPAEAAAKEMVATGVTFAAIFSMPAFRRSIINAVRGTVNPNAAHNVAAATPTYDSVRQGLSRNEQEIAKGTGMAPVLNRFTGTFDKNAPAKKAANLFKPPGDTESVDIVDHLMSGGENIRVKEAYNAWFTHGARPGMTNVEPGKYVEQDFDAMPPPKQELFQEYVLAKQSDRSMENKKQQYTQEGREAYARYRNALIANDTRVANKANQEFQELQAKIQRINQDAPESRPVKRNWDYPKRQQVIRDAESDPMVGPFIQRWNRVQTELMEMRVHHGETATQDAIDMMAAQPFYGTLWEVQHPNPFAGTVLSGLSGTPIERATRRALLFGDNMASNLGVHHKEEGLNSLVNMRASRKHKEDNTTIEQAMHPIMGLRRNALQTFEDVLSNNARRDIIDKFMSYPGANGTLIRPHMLDSGPGGRQAHQVSREQFQAIHGFEQIQKRNGWSFWSNNPVVPVARDGKIEFYDFGDGNLARSLMMTPAMTVPILNAMRVIKQLGLTAYLAQWFGPIVLLRDIPVAQMIKPKEYSFGLIDTYGRQIFKYAASIAGVNPNTANKVANETFGRFPDPTSYVMVPATLPYKIAMDAAEAVAAKIDKDLRTNSGTFNQLGQLFGQQRVQTVGHVIQAAFEQSSYSEFKRKTAVGVGIASDGQRVINDYDIQRANIVSRSFGKLIGALRYSAEAMQNATRYSFWAQNYKRGMTDAQQKKLIHATNNLVVDLSRKGQSKTVQIASSVSPFTGAGIQGIRGLMAAAVTPAMAKALNGASRKISGKTLNMYENNSNALWSMGITGVVAPALAMYYYMQDWEGASDHLFNQTPDWKRQGYTPFPSYRVLEYLYTNGQWPPFNPDDVNWMPNDPALGIFKAMVLAGFRGLGIIGPDNETVKWNMGGEMVSAAASILPFALPPVVDLGLAWSGYRGNPANVFQGRPAITEITPDTYQGGNPDMMDWNSVVPQWYTDVFSAIVGTAADVMMQTINVGLTTYDETEDIAEAFAKAFDTLGFEHKKHAPEIDIPLLYDSVHRYYVANPEGNYIHKVMDDTLAPVWGQRTVETDPETKHRGEIAGALGRDSPPTVNDPFLQGAVNYLHQQFKQAGTTNYKEYSDTYTAINTQISILEGNRYKMDDEAYQRDLNDLKMSLMNTNSARAKIITKTEEELQQLMGDDFERKYGLPLTYESIANLVRQNVVEQ